MKDLAITLRAAQLTAHNMHNLVKGCTFFEDHEHLGELYGAYEVAYDDVIERCIGLGDMPNLGEITRAACAKSCQYDVSGMKSEQMFLILLDMESSIRQLAAKYNTGASLGTQNFLQGLADSSEQRTYKLKQRTKNGSENGGNPIDDLLMGKR